MFPTDYLSTKKKNDFEQIIVLPTIDLKFSKGPPNIFVSTYSILCTFYKYNSNYS